MQDPLTRAQYYRDQAINMRTLAQNEECPEAKKGLISLAETYDRLRLKYEGLQVQVPDANVLRFKL